MIMKMPVIISIAAVAACAVLGGSAVAVAEITNATPVAAVKAAPQPTKTIIKKVIKHRTRKVIVTVPAPQAAAPAPAPAEQSGYAPDVTIVESYLNALNNGDLGEAWALGADNISGSSYNQFVQGQQNTASVTENYATDQGGGVVAVSFTSANYDGTVQTFAGTYSVNNGQIVSADIAQTG